MAASPPAAAVLDGIGDRAEARPALPIARRNSERKFGLDVMRCAAVLLVLQAHFLAFASLLYRFPQPEASGLGGLLGVDLFFGLSGFLIGRLLFDIARQGPSVRDWRIFMVRRWMRTVPLYALWLAVLVLVMPLPPDWHPADLLRYAVFAQNLAWSMPHSNWFAVSWSLAVEEWFYLLFSAAFLAAAVLAGAGRGAIAAVLLFIAVPVLLRQLAPGPEGYAETVLHVVVTRLDAIAYGVALAALWVHCPRVFRYPWLAGAAGVGLLWLFWGPRVAVWFSIPAVSFFNLALVADGVGVCLVLAGLAALPQPPRWLAAPVRGLSNMSYALYLTHLTFFDLVMRFGPPNGIGRGGLLAAMVVVPTALCYASWRWFEAPILARRPAQRKPLAAPAGA
jgi:peptidoglycan/LPS O-acetylase OafA/YrhL